MGESVLYNQGILYFQPTLRSLFQSM